ncbi:MAG: phospholipid/cholesterol/gamma-HCH transport system substrate-binding protein, partial [Planctomycetota bacterium]
MSNQRHLTLGLFFVFAAGVLGYFTLFMADVSFFGEKTEMRAYFSETNGLRKGDAVLVAGMRWGKVDSLTFRPDAEFSERIEVTFSLSEPVLLKEDVVIMIEDATLLGGKNLSIEPGSAGSPARATDAMLYGRVAGNVLEEVQKVVVDNQRAIKSAIDGLETIVLELQDTGGTIGKLINDEALGLDVAAAIASIAATFENLDIVTTQVAQGRGTVGKLLMEDNVYQSLEDATANLDGLFTEARSALNAAQDPTRGTLGLLWSDPTVARDLASSVSNINALTSGLAAGDGTLGRFLTDARLADNLTTLSQRLVDGDGTFGRLLNEDELYVDLAETMTNLRLATAQLNSNKGTLGRLL